LRSDAVVIGSGAAGLTAALVAAAEGADVVVLERAEVFGGTSSVSGGSLWIPNNRCMREAGIEDSREDALTYLEHVTLGVVPHALLERYVDECQTVIAFLESETGIEFEANLEHPDYQPDLPGARDGGRTIQNGLYDSKRLGAFKDKLRRGWTAAAPMTRIERDDRRFGKPIDYDLPAVIRQRFRQGFVSLGGALVGELMEACLRLKVRLEAGVRARRLLMVEGRIAGVEAERQGKAEPFEAELGVVLACGGFEWNQELLERFIGLDVPAPGSPPSNEGDGLVMAAEVGAALGNLKEAWWNTMYQVPGDLYEGRQLSRPTSDIRGLPGMIMVNRQGRRFVDEAMNYNDLSKALLAFDPVAYGYPNLPAWIVFDGEFRRTYSFATVAAGGQDPDWLLKADTLAELAELAGISPDGLTHQVAEFNRHAEAGVDPVFHRGETTYDRYRGERRQPSSPNLRPVRGGPFYAVPVHLGCFGTKGGPVTDTEARVLSVRGDAIEGLYAVGNVTASVFGPGYPGAGSTLGAGITFGHLAGRSIARRRAAIGS
jgi:3-oxosteroid 1-dehydrogenase